MTVLKQHPVAFILTLLYHLSGDSLLALTQTFIVESVIVVHLLGESNYLLSRVGTLTEHEDDGCVVVRAAKQGIHGSHRGLRILLPQCFAHIALESKH